MLEGLKKDGIDSEALLDAYIKLYNVGTLLATKHYTNEKIIHLQDVLKDHPKDMTIGTRCLLALRFDLLTSNLLGLRQSLHLMLH